MPNNKNPTTKNPTTKNPSNKNSHLTEWTATSLSREFRMDPKTMRRKLQGLPPHRVKQSASGDVAYYWMADVLAHLIADTGTIDGKKEMALLNKARREKVEIETKILEKQFCRVDDVKEMWAAKVNNSRIRMLALPSKMATLVSAAETIEEIDRILTEAVYESLEELSGNGTPTDT